MKIKLYLRIAIGIAILWLGIQAFQRASGGFDVGPFDFLQHIPLVLLILCTIIVILLDTAFYKVHKKIYHYAFSIIGLGFCAITYLKMWQHKQIDNVKTVLTVYNLAGGKNVMAFEFKENNKFKLTEFFKLGATVYYGTYQKNADTITIQQSNYNDYLPKTGFIKSDTVYWNGFDTMIVEK